MSQESNAPVAQAVPAGGKLSKTDKTRFCVAFFVFSFCWMLALQVVAAVLLPQRLSIIAPDSKDAIFGVLNSALHPARRGQDPSSGPERQAA